ncbi:hypothetical protein PV11_03469 [Exophiala sideris]|uniref:Uncharacterized protein n=1 Tax=Exophiala sideris TaxID=1016849 RepID=A0A0D1YE77_9EURO|nr:hypothetical protein PV11_03469 [Exophiala sideris]
MRSAEDVADLSRLQEEWNATRQGMENIFKADQFLAQTTSTIDNYALGDAVRFMVSTDGKTIRATNCGLGWRTRQVGGHMSNGSVQQLSRDMTASPVWNAGTERSLVQGDKPYQMMARSNPIRTSSGMGRGSNSLRNLSRRHPHLSQDDVRAWDLSPWSDHEGTDEPTFDLTTMSSLSRAISPDELFSDRSVDYGPGRDRNTVVWSATSQTRFCGPRDAVFSS